MAARILIVEDNLINQRVAHDTLCSAHYRVDVVANGQQALEATAATDYDLILLDWHMPVMDGFETVRALRSGSRTADVKVLAMTANVMSGDRERCLAAGMDDHIGKPIAPSALLERVAYWLGRPRTPGSAQDVALLPGGPGLIERSILAELAALEGDDGLALLYDLKQLIRETISRVEPELQDAVVARQWDRVAQAAHALKSSTGTLGLTALASACNALEQLTREGSTLEAELVLGRLRQLVVPSLAAMDAAIAELVDR